MNLDTYKLETPDIEGDDMCIECCTPCDGDYCSEQCYKESLQ